MNILVIGSGGREHALVRQFRRSPSVDAVYAAPGSDAMEALAERVPIAVDDLEALAEFAEARAIDLAFVGPEQPLAAGIADLFAARGLRVFGPSRAAARIESSKSFAKRLMAAHGIPTAAYAAFTDREAARAYILERGAPIVVKADGLAAGKGVVVAFSVEEALAAVDDMLAGNRFGASGARVVIEEFLEGEEFSLLSFVCGDRIYPLDIAQDHKRAFDGDKGPNTGGMGAYSPVPHIPPRAVEQALESIVRPVVRALAEEGAPFTGVLYAGLILTADGPKVIEFNARFGDPEAQVVLPRLKTDLAAFLVDLLDGRHAPPLAFDPRPMLGVVVAAEGYPEAVEAGALLPDLPDEEEDLLLFHAGTTRAGARYAGAGGRVLLAAARGETLERARSAAYRVLDEREWPGFFYRTDIGYRALDAERMR